MHKLPAARMLDPPESGPRPSFVTGLKRLATIGPRRRSIRADESLSREWNAAHGIEDDINVVVNRCPPKAIQLRKNDGGKVAEGVTKVVPSDEHRPDIDNPNRAPIPMSGWMAGMRKPANGPGARPGRRARTAAGFRPHNPRLSGPAGVWISIGP